MNWEAIGAIGEIMGALAVVATLGYLAVQIRQNTEREQLGQEFVSNQYFNELRMLIAGDEALADIEARGIRNVSSLSELERRRFDELMVSWIWAMQKFYNQDKASMVVTQFQGAIDTVVQRRFCGIGFVDWWHESRDEFVDEAFREDMDHVVERLAGLVAPQGGE